MMRADRKCSRCGPTAWRREVPLGARRARYSCIQCGMATKRIKGRRKRDVLPPKLYDHSKLMAECDELCRQIVRRRAGGVSEWSGKGNCELQCAHGIHRTVHATRHETTNIMLLTAGEHMLIEHDAELTAQLFVRKFGQSEWDRLQLLRRARGKVDLALTKLRLQQELSAMGEAVTR